MSLVTLIRDYVDVANSTEKLDGYTLSSLAYHTIIFLFTVAKQAIVYCFTFHWLRDLTHFCFTPPLILSSFANIGEVGKFIGDPSLHEVHSPLSHLLAFSDWNLSTGVGIVFVGFFNGCFSCLHLSAAHLITIRRMLVQGVPAGLYSALGTAIGQFSFLASIFFGFRGLLFPWLALEPLQFFLGTGIILSVASIMAQDRRTPTIQWSAKSSLFIYLCTNAVLAWCEQAAIFQWVGNFSLGAEPTFLETTPSLGLTHALARAPEVQVHVQVEESINSTIGETASNIIPNFLSTAFACAQNLSYLFAFFLGSVLGAFFLAFLLQRFLELVLRYKKIAVYYGLVKQANLPLATLLFAFGFGSMPYYGFDYLVTKGFGFIPQEHFFKQTLFSPINLVSKTSVPRGSDSPQNRLEDQLALFFTLEGERSKSFAVDTTPFDDGQYLKTSQKRPQAFEDLNYRGEHLWTNRLSRISNIREQANQTQSSFLGPIFSWMRSFLWGDEPGSMLTNSATNAKVASDPEVYGKRQITGVLPEDDFNSLRELDSASGANDSESNFPSELEELHQVHSQTHNRIENASRADAIHKKEWNSEMEENDNYLKEFDKQFDKGFSNFYDADPPSLIEVEDQWQEKRIKEKCYKNPIYKFLLNTEIDSFLARQPNSHWLSPEEEVLLLKRRQVLGNYYDTLALTNQVSTSEALEQLVPKSYANTIYNHQFKGTLKVARRLFSIKKASAKKSGVHNIDNNKSATFSELVAHAPKVQVHVQDNVAMPDARYTEGSEASLPYEVRRGKDASLLEPQVHGKQQKKQTRVVKFDQPLFFHEKESKNTPQMSFAFGNLFHEELLPHLSDQGSNTDKVASDPEVYGKRPKSNSRSTFNSRSELELKSKELMAKNLANKKIEEAALSYAHPIDSVNIPLLEHAESSPLYAGWDEQLRKFIVTNKYQNRTLAGYTFSNQFSRLTEKSQAVTIFTTWPIPDPFMDNVASRTSLDQKSYSEASPTKDSLNQIANSATSQDIFAKQIEKSQVSLKTNTNVQWSKLHPINHSSFLFQSKPATNDMVNALLQWQKLMKENKPQSTENKQVAKKKIAYWPDNIRRANWSNELVENDMEFDEPTENALKKKVLLWEFIPPYHGGFVWSTTNSATYSQ